MDIKKQEKIENWVGWIFSITIIILLIVLLIYYSNKHPLEVGNEKASVVYKDIKSQIDPSIPVPFEYACTKSDDCMSGYDCDILYGVCRLITNKPCQQTSDCQIGYYCNDICRNLELDPPNLLQEFPQVMQPCPCAEGFSCVYKDNSHYCLYQNSPLIRCNNSDECAEGNCSNNRCVAKIPNGNACGQDSECFSSNCSKNFCQPVNVSTGENIITGEIGALCTKDNTSGKSCKAGYYCQGEGNNAKCTLPLEGLSGNCSIFQVGPDTLGCYGLNSNNYLTTCDKADPTKDSGCVNSYFLSIDSDNVSSRPLPNQLVDPKTSVCSSQFTQGKGSSINKCLANIGMSCIDNSSCSSNNCSSSAGSIYLFQSSNVYGKEINDLSFFSNASSTDIFGINNVAYKKTIAPNLPNNKRIKIFGTIQGVTFTKEVNAQGAETFRASTNNLTENVYYTVFGNTTKKINVDIYIYEPLKNTWAIVNLVNYSTDDVMLDIGATTLYYGDLPDESSTYLYYITKSSDGKNLYVKRILVTINDDNTYTGTAEKDSYLTVSLSNRNITTFDVLDYNGINSNSWAQLRNASERPSFIFMSSDNVYYYQYDYKGTTVPPPVNNKIPNFNKNMVSSIKLAFGMGKSQENKVLYYPLLTYVRFGYGSDPTYQSRVYLSKNLDENIKVSGVYGYDNSIFNYPSRIFAKVSTNIQYNVKNYYYTHENPVYSDNNNFTIISNSFNYKNDDVFPNSLFIVSEFYCFPVPGYFNDKTILYTSSRNTFIYSPNKCI